LQALVLPYYQGAAVMGLLFPLFILLAADASPGHSPRAGADSPDVLWIRHCIARWTHAPPPDIMPLRAQENSTNMNKA